MKYFVVPEIYDKLRNEIFSVKIMIVCGEDYSDEKEKLSFRMGEVV